MIEGLLLTPLKDIVHPKGNVLHALKKSDQGFQGFGEAYFSIVEPGAIKGWKKHAQMVLNLIVPFGAIRFRVIEEETLKNFEITLSRENYQRLTIPAGLWVAFEGVATTESFLLNIASLEHDPLEAQNRPVEAFSWGELENP